MAAGRVLLATHDGHPGALRPLRQPAQAGFEPSALRHPSVEHTPLVIVETVPVRPPAELFPQKQVPDTGGVQVSLQGLPIELRVEARERRGPHIGHRLHRLSSQEFHEDLDRMGRVPDGQKIRTAHAIRISLVHAASCSAGPPTVIPSLRPDPVRGILVHSWPVSEIAPKDASMSSHRHSSSRPRLINSAMRALRLRCSARLSSAATNSSSRSRCNRMVYPTLSALDFARPLRQVRVWAAARPKSVSQHVVADGAEAAA